MHRTILNLTFLLLIFATISVNAQNKTECIPRKKALNVVLATGKVLNGNCKITKDGKNVKLYKSDFSDVPQSLFFNGVNREDNYTLIMITAVSTQKTVLEWAVSNIQGERLGESRGTDSFPTTSKSYRRASKDKELLHEFVLFQETVPNQNVIVGKNRKFVLADFITNQKNSVLGPIAVASAMEQST